MADHKVKVVQDTFLQMPDLYLEVFVVGDDHEERAFAEMFARSRCRKAESVETADLVVFTGGSDVSPRLYGVSSVHNTTKFNSRRDTQDILVYRTCYEKGIPMFGVCRGAQLGWVLAGGALYQDVDGHYGDHSIYDLKANRDISHVSSVHHQLCKPTEMTKNIEIVAISRGTSGKRWSDAATFETEDNDDIEAFFDRDSMFFGVQGHPEYRGYYRYMQWCLQMIEDLIVNNPDIKSINNNYRVSPDIIAQRVPRILKELA